MHQEWTDKLSEYLDDELTAADRAMVEAHLAGCEACTAVLADLTRVVERARRLPFPAPSVDLWPGIAERIAVGREERWVARRLMVSVPQLAAAAVLLIAVTTGLTWRVVRGIGDRTRAEAARSEGAGGGASAARATHIQAADPVVTVPTGLADQPYDAAVADLERALRRGRGRLDASTIAVVEHNLQIVDQAIAQARQALDADPANTYLSGYLVEARRRKLDLLRRVALGETD